MCAFCVFLHSLVQAVCSILSSPRAKSYINKHKIDFVFHLFLNTLIALEETHVLKTSVRVVLITLGN